MEITLGICGTAGRKEDGKKLSKQYFESMVIVANGLLEQCEENNYKITTLVSGGAAWSDFVAVHLYLNNKVPNLRLFLPAEWEDGSFKDTGQKDSTHNAGGTCNYYHKLFQNTTRINSLSQMQVAKLKGAEFIVVDKGFYARNYLVAKSSDFLLAMTFGNGSQIKLKSGTEHCVRCYLERVKRGEIFDKSFHYDLNNGKIYVECTVAPKEKLLQKK